MDEFNPYITKVDIDFWRDLCVREGELRLYQAGDFFLEAGKTGRFVGFVKSGALKYIANDVEGNEQVINLEFTGEFVADFPNSIYGIPSRVSIKAISPCEIYCISTKTLRNRLLTNKDFQFIVARTSEQLFRQVYDRLIESYTVTPIQRYEQLISKFPKLFEMFQLKDIASFLRITPGHLSRLRKEIREK
ncbi:MAG: Crp/Fnr family transcriptional regulator [Bacteroidales bacterium]|nr:Crp/Fnr family transcriptional regulator [Bacteroidales bacterium]